MYRSAGKTGAFASLIGHVICRDAGGPVGRELGHESSKVGPTATGLQIDKMLFLTLPSNIRKQVFLEHRDKFVRASNLPNQTWRQSLMSHFEELFAVKVDPFILRKLSAFSCTLEWPMVEGIARIQHRDTKSKARDRQVIGQ